MKFFALITIISALLFCVAKPFDNFPLSKSFKELPDFLKKQHKSYKESFQHPENGNTAWALMTGEKMGLSPLLKKDIKNLELGFLFSPGGLYLSTMLYLMLYFIKKSFSKKVTKIVQFSLLVGFYFLPFIAIKRIIILRFLMAFDRIITKRNHLEIVFFLTFALSYLLGHYSQSPLGFILSFLFIGTFISLRFESRTTLFIGVFSAHLLIAFFSGSEVSLLALTLNIPLISFFSILLPFLFLYLFLFYFHLDFYNWIELPIRFFIVAIHKTAKTCNGSYMSSTFFLILVVWIILLGKDSKMNSKIKRWAIIILLFLHSNTANTPCLFR